MKTVMYIPLRLSETETDILKHNLKPEGAPSIADLIADDTGDVEEKPSIADLIADDTGEEDDAGSEIVLR